MTDKTNLEKARAAWAALGPEERAAKRAMRASQREERAIRAERKALVKAEKMQRKAERMRRAEVRVEVGSNGLGGPIAQQPTYSALRGYHPLLYCEVCKRMRREDLMDGPEACIDCLMSVESSDREL